MKELLKWLTENPIGKEQVEESLNFTPGVNEATLRDLLRNGWWHVLPFASQSNGILALYMIPGEKWELWPVVKIYDLKRAVNFAPNIAHAAVFSVFESTYLDTELRTLVLEEWADIESAYQLLPTFMSEPELLSRAAATMRELNAVVEPLSNDEYYQRFWTTLYPEDEIRMMHEQITAITQDTTYLPTQILQNDPRVRIRYPHLQGVRAYSTFYESDPQAAIALIWSSLTAAAGYNAENIVVRHRPNNAYDSDIQDFELANLFVTVVLQEKMSQYIESPWYQVFQAINEAGNTGYRGKEHLVVARKLLEKKDVGNAWTALVSAAYWSGMNGGNVKWEAMKIAKQMLDSQGHTEISEVLFKYEAFDL